MNKLEIVYQVARAIFIGVFAWVVFNLAIQFRIWIEIGK